MAQSKDIKINNQKEMIEKLKYDVMIQKYNYDNMTQRCQRYDRMIRDILHSNPIKLFFYKLILSRDEFWKKLYENKF